MSSDFWFTFIVTLSPNLHQISQHFPFSFVLRHKFSAKIVYLSAPITKLHGTCLHIHKKINYYQRQKSWSNTEKPSKSTKNYIRLTNITIIIACAPPFWLFLVTFAIILYVLLCLHVKFTPTYCISLFACEHFC